MNTYLTLLQLSWSNGLVYRVSVFLWRLRQFLSTLMALTLWQVVFAGQNAVFNYTQSEMISYIFLVSVLQSIILTTSLHGLSSDIYSGKISHLLLKPINLFGYFAIMDVADKAKNIAFVCLETLLLFLLFQPTLSWPSFPYFLLFSVALVLGVLLYFVIILLFGTLGFWSPETWAPRFLFFMFIEFTAGKLFPLDILPAVFQKGVFLTPFPYFSYAQIQIFLERQTLQEALVSTLTVGVWVIILWMILLWVWKRGMKEYTATGL